MKKIIIVESPSKSKTIETYMGNDYKVVASNGHIRDLSTRGKGGLGIDIPAGFVPRYEILKDKVAKVNELKKICQGNEVFLATDPDREGEAISWHLASVLGLDLNTVNRVEFNEITKPAILEAFKHPRHIDLDLVSSQETRRMLDRIIGFQLSSLLQKKIKTKSAGRVQSSVLKLIVDLEKEINSFVSTPYYEINASYKDYTLPLIDAKNNTYKTENKDEALKILASLSKKGVCTNIVVKEAKRESKPALITSTLQQEASIKYGFSAERTMRAAQSLYEGKQIGDIHVGLISYMRTDSTRLSEVFVNEAIKYIEKEYGKEYCGYLKIKNHKGNVQDAHEAIRPTSLERTPSMVEKYLTPDERKIYKLIYNRSISSLMSAAQFENTTVFFGDNGAIFKLSGQRMLFDGFLKVYGLSEDDNNKLLPNFNVGDEIEFNDVKLLELFTKPKPYYTEASIIKAMEELGIGRPSTYAQTIQKLKSSKYITIVEKKIHPTDEGILSIEKLQEFFSSMIEPKYTAEMELMLDKVASGALNSVIELQKFYDDFYPIYERARKEMSAIEAKPTGEVCPLCGSPLVMREGPYGAFVACSSFPKCSYKKTKEEQTNISTGITCPNCGKGMIVEKKKNGNIFYACNNYPKCKTSFTYKPVLEFCPKCGSIMMASPDGLICSNRSCREGSKPKDEEIICPICHKGHLVMRTNKRKGKNFGKNFWACDNFPKCRTTFEFEPINELCPICGAQMVKKDDKISCSNEKCEKFIKL